MEKVTETKATNTFIDDFIACRKGESDAVIGASVWRSAKSALKTHIASLEGDNIELEDKLVETELALRNAKVNDGFKITNRAHYIENIINKQNQVIQLESELEIQVGTLDFLKEVYDKLQK